MRIIILTTLFIFTSLISRAQILNRLKDRAKGKAQQEAGNAKYEAKNKARSAAQKELDDFHAGFDSTDIDYAVLLSDNAGLFGGRGRNESASKFVRLGAIANSLYKDQDLNNEENARLNLQFAQSSFATGRFVFAEKRFNAAKKYFEMAGLTDDLGYVKTISGQGLLYTSMGRYEQAEKINAQALQLRKEKFGEGSMAVAASMNNYSVLHYNKGLYNEAEREIDESLELIIKNNRKESMAYAIAINNKAILFQSMGRYEAGAQLLEEAIKLSSRLDVSKSKQHLKFYSNLALLYQQMGKYAEAERIYQGLEKRLEKGKAEYANMLNNLAILYLVMNKEDKVEEMLRRSAGVFKATVGEKNPAYAKVISDLGNFLRYKGRYDEAAPMLEGVLQSREIALGKNHPLYVQSQEDLAILYWKRKEFSKADPLFKTVMDKSLDFINKYFAPMSEAEKTKYWDILSPRFNRFYNYALDAAATDNTILTNMLEYRLATKGLLLSSARKVNETIQASGNQQLLNDYLSWIDMKEQLAAVYTYSAEEMKEQGIDVDSLENEANRMEKKLSGLSKEFSQYYFANKVGLGQVQEKIKADEAVVEFIRLGYFDQVLLDSCRYIAMIITRNTKQPELVVFTDGLAMEGKHAKSYKLMIRNKISDDKSYGYFWAPLEEKLKGKKRIYVSPDGVYNQISLYTLKKPAGDYLLNQYDLLLVGNPKDIITLNSKKSYAGKKATLIGFPDYGKGNIPQLPATKTECDGIQNLLKPSGYQVSELLQQDASESNLKAAQKVTILHIATHGYFLQDASKVSWPIGVHADNAKDNVLLRSGLMLAGASEADKQQAGLHNSSNGIITAYEAMGLDLKGTKLVVLSACETALGEVKAGEGVYGLQRAFLIAGAEALIMSLWKVDDAATQQLMQNFYSGWTKTGDIEKSFKQAQQQLMTKYKEPYYWGAFVMLEN